MTELTIVIPAYNESRKIAKDISAADEFLTSAKIEGDIIVVDDGSADETVATAKKAAIDIQTPCFVEKLEKNYGKGRAVRAGILKSQGDYIIFADSGTCVPFEQAKIGMDLIESGQCHIAHGSRKLSDCHILRPQSFHRRICSKLFHWFLIHDIKRIGNLTDTQCGFKVYNGSIARQLYAESQINGFMFDIEIILLALAKGYRICEFAVDWTCDPDSRLNPTHEVFSILRDLIKLKRQFRSITAK
jgi:dolichyl-phosphate beta-glucosyltransferase